MNNQRGFFFNVDWITVLIYLALCTIGWFNIHAAVFDENHPSILDLETSYGRQFIFILTGLVLGTVILLLESRFLSAVSPALYVVTVLMLILVLAVGRGVGGNQAWIDLGGGFKLQPSEFAKFATCLLLARYLSATNVKVTDPKSFLIAGGIILLPMVLIKMQPDDGSTLVFCSLIFVLYREGLSTYFLVIGGILITLFITSLIFNEWYVVIAVIIVTVLAAISIKRNRPLLFKVIVGAVISIGFIFAAKPLYNKGLKKHQRDRIDVVLGLSQDKKHVGYNQNQSIIAIGSGRVWGKGYLQGTQTKYAFVPAQSTDFIFCTIGEEWGFAGSVTVLGLYLFLLLRIILIAERQRAPFSRIYGYGVASIIFCHVIINIAMAIGYMPVIGIPLPFISYGGSSLWSFTILLFILLKLDSNRMGINHA
ncbi:rod shape-determining protein RodA [Mucilaginibacter phyllosphaerae]|uniref:Rod shape-determining protein RodA n=1 Tax=Mucilaginibacter phyllosphaerae TaxID=1812349 RepID=A0A4Y8AJY4_9SPHI|nr:rod shape-determining protein RodA [Mucilaginibacter phyllosphaerae]MBB3967619.1 rod shape determining protein RodA [Mucilaginibacter phyllosphaerae]TEW69324.1 rod shape-determining protein RodA [Mucilaginibacter phyllosphaerae]GGH21749.1 rod shape-determining protein RodA [Mucilaginibacter phyllosphaerae]